MGSEPALVLRSDMRGICRHLFRNLWLVSLLMKSSAEQPLHVEVRGDGRSGSSCSLILSWCPL